MNRHAMTFPNACLFNKTAAQCRAVGARGGRARALNLSARSANTPAAPPAEPDPDPETAHEASETLDHLFPHLAEAFAPRRTKRAEILALLQRDCGATLDDIVRATGWPRRNARSFRSAVGANVVITRTSRADGTTVYLAAR